ARRRDMRRAGYRPLAGSRMLGFEEEGVITVSTVYGIQHNTAVDAANQPLFGCQVMKQLFADEELCGTGRATGMSGAAQRQGFVSFGGVIDVDDRNRSVRFGDHPAGNLLGIDEAGEVEKGADTDNQVVFRLEGKVDGFTHLKVL